MTREEMVAMVLQKELDRRELNRYSVTVHSDGRRFSFSSGEIKDGFFLKLSDRSQTRLLSPEDQKKELDNICGIAESLFKRLYSLRGDYERLRPDLVIRPVSYKQNAERLEKVPHKKLGDIALVLYQEIEIPYRKERYWTSIMTCDPEQSWGKSSKEVLRDALANTAEKYPAKLIPYSVIPMTVGNLLEGFKLFDILENEPEFPEQAYVLSNSENLNGASALFYPGVMDKIGKICKEDYYVSFISMHEAIITPVSKMGESECRRALQTLNRDAVDKDNFLSDTLFRYDVSEKKLKPILGQSEDEEKIC